MLYNLNIMFIEKQKHLGEKVRQARSIAHLSQIDLAKIIGIGKNSMIDTEKGRREPGLTELNKIAEATNQDIKFFLEKEKPEIKPSDNLLDATGLTDEQKDLMQRLIDTCKQKEDTDPKNELEKSIIR